jgi:orotate phosphoribosyltransferase
MKIDQIPEDLRRTLSSTEALLEGHFVLSSGLHSAQYLQCAKIFQFPDVTEELCRGLAAKLTNQAIDATLSPALGGIVIGYELARALKARAIFAERPEARFALRRGFSIKPQERILIVEDVITTGGSVMELYELAQSTGGEVIGFAALIDRSGGAFKPPQPVYSWLQLEIPTFRPEDCPLCKEGIPITKPGSRSVCGAPDAGP